MQSFIFFFMIFALSLAVNVSVYDLEQYYRGNKNKPVFKSAAPWKFGFTSRDQLHMAVFYWNRPPGVTMADVTFESDLVTVEWNDVTIFNGKKIEVFDRQFSGPEAIVNVDLYTSEGLCTSIRVAEGRLVSEKSEKEYKYADVCFKEINSPCMFVVDLKGVICDGPSIVTQNSTNKTKTMALTDLENNNKTFVSNVSSSPHAIMETSTNSSANNTGPSIVTQNSTNKTTTTALTDLENNNTTFVSNVSSSSFEIMTTSTNSSANNTVVQPTNDTVIIIGSISGITLILVAVIAILIQTRVLRCCTKHSPQATPDLPTNPHTEPFYQNMLFRRECDQEIAEIDEHQYEEINPQRPERVPEGS